MALESRKTDVQHNFLKSTCLCYPGSTTGWVGPPHDLLSHGFTAGAALKQAGWLLFPKQEDLPPGTRLKPSGSFCRAST